MPIASYKKNMIPHKLAAVLLAVLFVACLHPVVAQAADDMPEAEELRQGVQLTLASGNGTAVLRDNSRGSKQSLTAGDVLAIHSETPFAYVYLIWDTPPGPAQLSSLAGKTQTGTHGYLHELVSLEMPMGTAHLHLDAESQAAYKLCEVYLFGEGELPAWVQQWQPPLGDADLLALPTHADDEHLFFGGILPTYAGDRGMAVQVVYMTHHWAEPYRPHELLDGLWTVGVTAYPVIGPFQDLYASLSGLEAAEQVFGRQAVLAFQVEMLRRFKPEVVVGHDLNGEYGHGAHILNAQTLVEALALSGDAASFPESAAGYSTWEVQKAYLHLYPEQEIVMDWNIPLARFDGKTGYEMAVEGFAKHASQQGSFRVRLDGTWHDCRKFGLVHSTVGPDAAGDDLFENVVWPTDAETDDTSWLRDIPSSQSEAASLSEPVASVSGDSSSSSPEENKPIRLDAATLLWIGVGAVALVLVLVLLVLPHKRKKR